MKAMGHWVSTPVMLCLWQRTTCPNVHQQAVRLISLCLRLQRLLLRRHCRHLHSWPGCSPTGPVNTSSPSCRGRYFTYARTGTRTLAQPQQATNESLTWVAAWAYSGTEAKGIRRVPKPVVGNQTVAAPNASIQYINSQIRTSHDRRAKQQSRSEVQGMHEISTNQMFGRQHNMVDSCSPYVQRRQRLRD